jgi:DNA repair and recombination protein RAD52
MTFTPEQTAKLNEPLSSSAVKDRQQGGRKVSYIEGWHAIAEANRIFGFDAWTRETDEIRCVSERERQLGSGKAGWGVTYICRVRVRVGNVMREGCGAGHGIDQDLGQAHESAIKEAETDAMKRALMTFGNPFGLALYDKTQSNVSDEKPMPADIQQLLDDVAAAETLLVLQALWRDKGKRIFDAGGPHSAVVNDAFNARKAAIDVMDRCVA